MNDQKRAKETTQYQAEHQGQGILFSICTIYCMLDHNGLHGKNKIKNKIKYQNLPKSMLTSPNVSGTDDVNLELFGQLHKLFFNYYSGLYL